MKIKVVKISENIYNANYDVGSIFENSVNFVMNDGMFEDDIEKVTKDKIVSASFRRTFLDKNLSPVTIELSAPIIDDDKFIDLVEKIAVPENVIVKEQDFSLSDYLNKITVVVNEEEYEISKESELGKQLIDVAELDILMSRSNQDIIASIEL